MRCSYCPPEQVIPVTVIFDPLVIATQSSWFLTTVFDKTTFEQPEKSKPSELCAAAKSPLAELGESPAELSSVKPVMVRSSAPVTSKQWTGQFSIFKFDTTPLVMSLRTMKWSGLSQVSLLASNRDDRAGLTCQLHRLNLLRPSMLHRFQR